MLRLLALCLALATAAPAQTLDTGAGPVTVTPMITGLDEPWALGFLPDGGVLVTERGGRLLLHRDGTLREVAGVPRVAARGQGGLLDLLVPGDFAQTRTLFFTYSRPQPDGAGTAVARARLSSDATRLEDWQVIFELTPGSSGGRHFGSRLVEGADRRRQPLQPAEQERPVGDPLGDPGPGSVRAQLPARLSLARR